MLKSSDFSKFTREFAATNGVKIHARAVIASGFLGREKCRNFVIASERIARSVAIHSLPAVSVGYFRKCVNLKSVSKK